MKFWGSATLATGVFLTYLIPETLLFIPLFKMFAVFNDWTDIQLINKWWVLLIVYPTLTVPFCTWIMIGYFASIPKELDEAALIWAPVAKVSEVIDNPQVREMGWIRSAPASATWASAPRRFCATAS